MRERSQRIRLSPRPGQSGYRKISNSKGPLVTRVVMKWNFIKSDIISRYAIH